ncbi:hypothetical protein ASPZODRAFT_20345 [Penicilliopsis zonata CBS 506.65]|uniref:Dickkopf N-terminal cysteine-rich domain-containing protein n=1 Tax=Penicilliopsis zonata CBS 506.65 TaxID=1073090 RepID=A0A1L9S5Y1_9EURO|nr:hypothetical protein ASPZODRAFT_20345 [Penicilliopsis zonata CBS 506.65]OJJ42578.1 hypothetical protein ASPZODRAFT_20345 [Penicilliopsis zonata CBS 506.65]
MWPRVLIFLSLALLTKAQSSETQSSTDVSCDQDTPCPAGQYCQVSIFSGFTENYYDGFCHDRGQVGDACPQNLITNCAGDGTCNPCSYNAYCSHGLCRYTDVDKYTACESDAGCSADKFCRIVADDEEDLLYSTCEVRPQVGDSCEASELHTKCPVDAQCTHGLCQYVNASQHIGCRSDEDCDGTSCRQAWGVYDVPDQDGEDEVLLYSVCQSIPEVGEACDPKFTRPCFDDAYCVGGRCVRESRLNGYCNLDDGYLCGRGTLCDDRQRRCLSDGSSGQDPCGIVQECSSAAYCDGSICRRKRAVTETCSSNGECESETCVQGVCAPDSGAVIVCASETDCPVVAGRQFLCQPNQGEADSAFARVCGRPITSGYGQRCKTTADCATDGYSCYKGDCMDRYKVQGKACQITSDCGGSQRKGNSADFYYIKFGFTCTNNQCEWFNKNDGCVGILDKITVNCYD